MTDVSVHTVPPIPHYTELPMATRISFVWKQLFFYWIFFFFENNLYKIEKEGGIKLDFQYPATIIIICNLYPGENNCVYTLCAEINEMC